MNLRLASFVALALSVTATSAYAEDPPKRPEGRYPVAQADRPLTLGKQMISAEVDLDIPHVTGFGSYLNFTVGGSYGVTDDLTVRATILPIQVTGPAGSGFHFGQSTGYPAGIDSPGPSVGATYRFYKQGMFEIGGSVDLTLLTAQLYSGAIITPGVPVRIHVMDGLRIDTGAYLPIGFASVGGVPDGLGGTKSSSASATGLTIPVSALYDITEPIHVGVSTGFGIADFSFPGDSVTIPLGIFAGYAIAGPDGPMLDIDPFFTFPALTGGSLAPGASTWVLGVSVGGFYYL